MVDLKISREELEGYGPYEPEMRKIALFSVANDFEAHGYPMPPHTDTLLAQNWCMRIVRQIGASYIAHIPYCTDRVGEIAVNWSPDFIPFEEFYSKLLDFVKWHVEHLRYTPSKVVIIIGHGGNYELPEREEDLTKAIGVPVRCMMAGVSEALVYPEFEALDVIYEIVAAGGEHAYMLEYSLIAHLGHFDYDKLDVLNKVAAKDPLQALKRWPAIAGLGGYMEFGGPEYDPLREIEGLCIALEDFKKRRKILVDAELGKRATDLVVNYFCEKIQE